MLYLPDTNIIIYALAGIDSYARSLKKAITEDSLGISVIVAAEFLSGANKDDAQVFEKLVDEFGALPVTFEIASVAAAYRQRYAKKKVRLPDALIAATAKVHGATLVTNNLRDFPMDDIEKILPS